MAQLVLLSSRTIPNLPSQDMIISSIVFHHSKLFLFPFFSNSPISFTSCSYSFFGQPNVRSAPVKKVSVSQTGHRPNLRLRTLVLMLKQGMSSHAADSCASPNTETLPRIRSRNWSLLHIFLHCFQLVQSLFSSSSCHFCSTSCLVTNPEQRTAIPFKALSRLLQYRLDWEDFWTCHG